MDVLVKAINQVEAEQTAQEQYKVFCEQFEKDVIAHCDKKLDALMSTQFRPCVIIDIDDTALDRLNQFGELWIHENQETFPLFQSNQAILDLCIKYFVGKKIDIFYVTARDEGLREVTAENLEYEGYPQIKNLCCLPSNLREEFMHQYGPIKTHHDEFRSVVGRWKYQQYTLFQESGYTVIAMIDDEPSNLERVKDIGCGFLFKPLLYWYLLEPTQ